MQVRDIKFTKQYAIYWRGDLVRFSPISIIRTTTNAGGLTEVRGSIPVQDTGGDSQYVTVKPDKLLGEATAYEALVAKKNSEDAAKKAREEETKAKQLELWRLLHELAGLDIPIETNAYDNIIRASYGDSVDIEREAFDFLIEAIKDVLASRKFLQGSVTPIVVTTE